MTRISASFGEVHALALRERDLVRTKSDGFLPILWLDRIKLDEEFLELHPDAQPVIVSAGSLGRDVPSKDICLSPGQSIASLPGHYSSTERTAFSLLELPGVFRKPETSITYTRFHLGKPVAVRSEGLWLANRP